MKTYHIHQAKGISSLVVDDINSPKPASNQVLVSMQAWSLNYRDLAMPSGGYPGNTKVVDDPPLVPLSDGAGEVIAVGRDVTEFKPGDKVASCFFENWSDGPISLQAQASARGGAIDGVLAEEVLFAESGLVKIPKDYSFAQAACLPCAGVTAFEALRVSKLAADELILTLGTGGVSLFALQFAKALGARVCITSSSEEKLERAIALGADFVVNYREFPDWDEQVLNVVGSSDVDQVIELGGEATFERSLNVVKVGGHVSLIGVLSGVQEKHSSPMPILFKRLRVQGIYVGSKHRFIELIEFVEKHNVKPVIDRSFSFGQAEQAYRYLKSGAHFGKIVIER